MQKENLLEQKNYEIDLTGEKTVLSWKEKFDIAMKERFTVKDIMNLYEVGQHTASRYRKNALTYCKTHKIPVDVKAVPSEAVFATTNRSLEYYEKKMIMEANAINLFKGNRGVNYVCA